MKQSQCEAVLDYIKMHGSITGMEALDKLGCFRLASRISDLKQEGNIIDTIMIETPSGKRIAKYVLGQKQRSFC